MASYSHSRGRRMHGNHFLLTEKLLQGPFRQPYVEGRIDGLAGCARRKCASKVPGQTE